MKRMTSMERLSYQLNWLEGMLEAKRETTGKVLVWRFGQISQALQKQIGELSLAQLDALFDAALRDEGGVERLVAPTANHSSQHSASESLAQSHERPETVIP